MWCKVQSAGSVEVPFEVVNLKPRLISTAVCFSPAIELQRWEWGKVVSRILTIYWLCHDREESWGKGVPRDVYHAQAAEVKTRGQYGGSGRIHWKSKKDWKLWEIRFLIVCYKCAHYIKTIIAVLSNGMKYDYSSVPFCNLNWISLLPEASFRTFLKMSIYW